jgi:hypothetical protein
MGPMLGLVNLLTFIDETGINLHRISQGSGIAYSTLSKHKLHGTQLTMRTARALHEFDERMTVADLLGVTPEPAPKKTKTGRKAA